MASLTRIRAGLSRKIVIISCLLPCSRDLGSSHFQPLARALQTAADSTQLHEDASHSEPFTVKLHDDTFHGFKTDTPSLEVEVTKEGLIGMYKQMTTMRRMEQAADALYRQKLVRGFCHLAIGQVCTATHVRNDQSAGFSQRDAVYVCTGYRKRCQ